MGPKVVVHQDAGRHGKPAALRQFKARADTTGQHQQIAVNRGSVIEQQGRE
jgi:hypothetical protein